MKKIIAMLLLLTMALGLFAGCNGTEAPSTTGAPKTNGLADAKAYLQAMYKENNGTAYTRDFKVVSVVAIDGVTYPVTWSIEVTAGDSAAVSVADNGDKTATVSILNSKPTEEVQYNLVGTLTDAEGKTETVTFNYVIPAVEAAGGTTFAENPEVGTGYKFALEQNEIGKTLYFTGAMDGYYMASSENPLEAVDVYLEEAEGGLRVYFMDGSTKTYIDIIPREGYTDKANIALTAEPTCVYTWDAERGTLVAKLAEASFYLGTYGTYTTFSVSNFTYIEDVSKVGVSQFPAGFATVAVSVSTVDAPAVGTAYKYVVEQNEIGKSLYFTGAMDGYYLATSTNPGDGVDVYLEEVEGGLRVYFMDGSTKTYIDIIPREGYTDKANVTLTAEPTCVYTWDTERGTLVAKLAEASFYLGTYGTYTTFSVSNFTYIEDASKVGVSQFPAGFATVALPVSVVEAPVVNTAYKYAVQQNGIGQTLYFTGAMDGYYLATSTSYSAGVDVFLEEVEGGLRLYFMDGETKTYIDIIPREGYTDKANVTLTAEPTCVYTWDAERGTLVAKLAEASFYLGTYGTYTTFSVSNFTYIEDASKVGVSQYPAGFAAMG